MKLSFADEPQQKISKKEEHNMLNRKNRPNTFPNRQTNRPYPAVLLMILIFCSLTTLMQGIPALSGIPRGPILYGCICLFLASCGVMLFLHRRHELTEDRTVFFLIFCGLLFHSCYVLLSGLYDRQHDEGVYTGIATAQVNPGHIGYIEYIYKFRRLPDMNPYQLFSYYHPPLHYALSGIWLIFLTSLGMAEGLAFENLQVLPLFYSGLFMLLTCQILKKTGAAGKGLYAGLLLACAHPALTIMSGSINNDMLSSVLLACAILASLCWLREKTLRNLLCIALSIGFGMLCKINTAVIALPTGLIFLMDFIGVIRTKEKTKLLYSLRNYILFGCTAGSIGLCWIARNLIRFHVKPGISSSTEDSVMYTGNYGLWARIGLPSLSDWHFDFPFHPLSGDAIHNTWVIMFQTSLFTEEYPTLLTGLPLLLCRTAYIAAILSAVFSALLFFTVQYTKWKRGTKETGCEVIFLSAGYLGFLLSFVLFAIKYPYTCSSDFRYIVICLIYIAVGLADSERIYSDTGFMGVCSRIIRLGVCFTLVLMTIVYLSWGQW